MNVVKGFQLKSFSIYKVDKIVQMSKIEESALDRVAGKLGI